MPLSLNNNIIEVMFTANENRGSREIVSYCILTAKFVEKGTSKERIKTTSANLSVS